MLKKFLPLTIFLLALFMMPHEAFATRLLTTGFEYQGINYPDEHWDNLNLANYLSVYTSIKRSGNASMGLNSTSSISSGVRQGSRLVYTTTASTTTRVYVYFTAFPNATTTFFSVTGASSFPDRGNMQIGPAGILRLRDDNNAAISPDTAPLSLNTWYRLEIKHYRNATGNIDTIEGKIDGVVFATSNTASLGSTAGGVALGINIVNETATSGMWYFDDIAVNNAAAATTQNDYPGAGSIVNLYPNAAGDSTQGSSGTGGSGWDDIDEKPDDGNTSYWQLVTNNDILDVNLPNSSAVGIGSTDAITLVAVQAIVRNDATGASTYNVRLKSQPSGTVTSGTSVGINNTTWHLNDDGSDHTPRIISTTEPQAGGAWTPALIDSMQIGARATVANPDLLLTSLFAVVEYVPAAPAIPNVQHRVNFKVGRILFKNGRVLFK